MSCQLSSKFPGPVLPTFRQMSWPCPAKCPANVLTMSLQQSWKCPGQVLPTVLQMLCQLTSSVHPPYYSPPKEKNHKWFPTAPLPLQLLPGDNRPEIIIIITIYNNYYLCRFILYFNHVVHSLTSKQ